MRKLIAIVLAAFIAVPSASAKPSRAVLEDVMPLDGMELIDISDWRLVRRPNAVANEKFSAPMVAQGLWTTWGYNGDLGFAFQCAPNNTACVAIECWGGWPFLIITDPQYNGAKIRFWGLDYERKTKTPLAIVAPSFSLGYSMVFKRSAVRFQLSSRLVRGMTFGDTIRIAYSFPQAETGVDGANKIFVHGYSVDGPANPDMWFDHCADAPSSKVPTVF